MKTVIEPIILKVGPWFPTPGPFSETEFEDLNNFNHFFLPVPEKLAPGQISGKRYMFTLLPGRIDKVNRDALKDPSNFSELFLNQTAGQFLSTVEDTAAEIGGSFRAVQDICCKWAKDLEPEARRRILANKAEWDEAHQRREEWVGVRNSIYRALRERGYAIRELIQ